MTGTDLLELAASVVWPFKDLNRPLGEVLESGEVRTRDLGWAAWNAYDPTVKWAAAVQLKAEALRQVTLSPAAAREVLWPFKDLNRPIGELLDVQTINLYDLAYAVAQARVPEVRDAAAVLGGEIVRRKLVPGGSLSPESIPATAKEVPPPPVATPPVQGGVAPVQLLEIIDGSHYLTDQMQKKQRLGIIVAIGMLYVWGASLLISVGALIVGIVRGRPVSLGWSVAAAVLLGGALLLEPQLERLLEAYDNYDKGRKGERRIVTGLQRALKSPWVFFRNVTLPGSRDDIDAVLIGPEGIYALEIKTFNGYYRNIGDRWQRHYAVFWRSLSRNPSHQALRNAQRLHDYLQQCGVTVWVEPRVVWASESKVWLEHPAVPVWQVEKRDFIAEDLIKGKPLDEAARLQIVGLLKANNLSHVQADHKAKARS
mgnify:CR=1 FL=1